MKLWYVSNKTFIHIQLLRYVISGTIAIAIDLGVYFALSLAFPYAVSKAGGFISGSIVAFLLNKFWTFQRKELSFSQTIKFALLYCCSISINILSNAYLLTLTQQLLLAFGLATTLSTLINYFGQRFWVFKPIQLESGNS